VRLQKIAGSDAALYLVFLRYCALLFGIIAALNMFFIVIFVTGEPLEEDNFRKHLSSMYPMQALTILNITNSRWKVTVCFLNSMLVVVALCFNLILSYSNKFKFNELALR
jgi:hypothetical protein